MSDPQSARHPYQYAILRAVPRVDRGEMINVGVLLYCQHRDWLGGEIDLDADRLLALCPDADVDGIRRSAEAAVLAATEPVGTARESTGRAVRFGMLVAPRSTVIQPSAVHTGLTADPATTVRALMDRLVRTPARR